MDWVDKYFQRFGFIESQLKSRPASDLKLIVVIPCHDEPDLVGSLKALWACDSPSGEVEVIVVVNSSVSESAEVKVQNLRSVEEATDWIAGIDQGRMAFHIIHLPDLPHRHAGVGLSRKVGMDEALRRFREIGRLESGVMVAFDADCRCDLNYLVALENHFDANPGTPACSIYFEHPLEGPFEAGVYDAVAAYELHLRYYIEAMRFASIPHAYQTIGSSMAVRAETYGLQGGMNRRKAGEDFYFLHKIIPLGGFTELGETTVIPSPRPSHRVPFGTGRAVNKLLENGGGYRTYPWEAFVELRAVFTRVDDFWSGLDWGRLSELMTEFLVQYEFETALEGMKANCRELGAFRNRFYRWFDGFRVMKFIHHVRDSGIGDAAVEEVAADLLDRLGEKYPPERNAKELLRCYRRRARHSWPS